MALLDVDDISKELKVPRPRAYALLREGAIPAVRIGRTVRARPEDVADFIRSGGNPLTGETNGSASAAVK